MYKTLTITREEQQKLQEYAKILRGNPCKQCLRHRNLGSCTGCVEYYKWTEKKKAIGLDEEILNDPLIQSYIYYANEIEDFDNSIKNIQEKRDLAASELDEVRSHLIIQE